MYHLIEQRIDKLILIGRDWQAPSGNDGGGSIDMGMNRYLCLEDVANVGQGPLFRSHLQINERYGQYDHSIADSSLYVDS